MEKTSKYAQQKYFYDSYLQATQKLGLNPSDRIKLKVEIEPPWDPVSDPLRLR